MSELWIGLVITPILLWMCGQDIRDQTVDGRWILLLALCGAGAGGLPAAFRVSEVILPAFAPGVLLMAVSLLTGGILGEGDALIFWAMGFFMEAETIGIVCLESFLMAGIAGAVWCCCRPGTVAGAGRWKMRLPFLPFLGAAWCMELLL